MNFKFFRNNKNAATEPQQPAQTGLLKPVISIYLHRSGQPVRVHFVKSTALPPHRYESFLAWKMRIHTDLIAMLTRNQD